MNRPSGWRKGLFGLLLIYSLFRLLYSVWTYNPIRTPSISGDFQASYAEALHWRQTGEFKLMGFTNVPYPPFFYWWLFPLTHLPYPSVSALLYVSQFFLFAWALALLAKSAAADSRLRLMDLLACALLAVNFQPFLETLSTHKIEGLELFLICAAIFAFKKGRDLGAGALIFLAAGLKYLPGILLLYFLLKKETRVVAGFLLAGALCMAAFALSFGPHAAWDLGVRQTLWVGFHPDAESNHPMANFEWQSLSQVLNSFFAQAGSFRALGERLNASQAVPVAVPKDLFWLGIALKSLFFAGFLFLVRRRPREDRARRWPLILLEISITLLMLPILLQAFRIHYGILLLPAFAATGLLILSNRDLMRLKEKVLFGLGFALSGMLIPGGLLNKLPAHPSFGGPYARLYEWWSLPFYGYMLFSLSVLLCYKRFQGALLQK